MAVAARVVGVVAAVAVTVASRGAALVVLGGFAAAVASSRRAAADRRFALERSRLPETAELLAVALSAGLSVPRAVEVVATMDDHRVGAGLRSVVRACEQGSAFVDGCRMVADREPALLGGLLSLLAVADRSGGAARDLLVRFADHERELHRRRAQERLRRLPVRLLPPLVTCVLPAFLLSTLLPVVLAVIGSLSLPSTGG